MVNNPHNQHPVAIHLVQDFVPTVQQTPDAFWQIGSLSTRERPLAQQRKGILETAEIDIGDVPAKFDDTVATDLDEIGTRCGGQPQVSRRSAIAGGMLADNLFDHILGLSIDNARR
jgi:hypothetical protein